MGCQSRRMDNIVLERALVVICGTYVCLWVKISAHFRKITVRKLHHLEKYGQDIFPFPMSLCMCPETNEDSRVHI